MSKTEITKIMIDLLQMVDELVLNPNDYNYLQICETFKQANMNLHKLIEYNNILKNSKYYRNYILNTKERPYLTEIEKSKNNDYKLCSCGRFIKFTTYKKCKKYREDHLKSAVHIQGIRNRKYSSMMKRVKIDDEICREILLNDFCIKHQKKINNEELDTEEYTIELIN